MMNNSWAFLFVFLIFLLYVMFSFSRFFLIPAVCWMGLPTLVLFGNKENPLLPQKLRHFSFPPLCCFAFFPRFSSVFFGIQKAATFPVTLPIPNLVDRQALGYSDAKRGWMARPSDEE